MGRSFNTSDGGVTPFFGAELLAGVNCPTLSANTNNYSFNNLQFKNASILLLSASAAINFTGLVGSVPNREIVLLNTGAFNITLVDSSGLSLAQNRFSLGGSNIEMTPSMAVRLLGLPTGGWTTQGGGGGGGGATLIVTDGTHTVTGATEIEFTGATVTPSGSIAQVAVGGRNSVYAALPDNGEQDNFAPAGFDVSTTDLYVTGAGNNIISGFACPSGNTNGAFRFWNAKTVGISLTNLNAGSSAANQIVNAGSTTLNLDPEGSVWVVYDNTNLVWRTMTP